ncbi:MAG: M24 family metallopeptidase [Candidatus Dormibacteria bacterium]
MEAWRFVDPGQADAALGTAVETRSRLTSLRQGMDRDGLDGLYLERWANVAWLCGGRSNRVVLASEVGACAVMIGANGAWLLLPNNEESRGRNEVFGDLPLPVVTSRWWDRPLHRSAQRLLSEGAKWASDTPIPGAADGTGVVEPLRRALGESDIKRYRALGRDTAEALEAALLEVNPEWQELHVAAAIEAELKARGIDTSAALVGGGARAERFRHPVPTATQVGGGLVASVTGTRHGLHASVTRSLSFGPVTLRRRERHHAAVAVDSAYLSASRPGVTLGAILSAAEVVYTDAGYYDEWQEHDQGGTSGYASREVLATPRSGFSLQTGMAVAWNPTVPGARSEDTVLVRDDGLELLTFTSGSRWPVVYADAAETAIPRTGILVL